LLDIIRQQEKIVKFSNKVMSILLSENEMYKLHQRAKWDDERGEWDVPYFTFNPKQKDIAFPSIGAKQRVEHQMGERDIGFLGEGDDGTGTDSGSHLRMNGGKRNHQYQSKTRNVDQSTRNSEMNHIKQGMFNHSADDNSSKGMR